MFTLLKNGNYVVNRATYEYMCDDVADLDKIPKDKMNLGSTALVVTPGELKVFICDGKDNWIEV